ncbi:MAG: hypothetical protein P1P89_05490 [Desulfobacterales bacterium]|nr:hypothetical protein [Desulfobacterales bacterium]
MTAIVAASDLIVSLVVPAAARQVATELASALSAIKKKLVFS